MYTYTAIRVVYNRDPTYVGSLFTSHLRSPIISIKVAKNGLVRNRDSFSVTNLTPIVHVHSASVLIQWYG